MKHFTVYGRCLAPGIAAAAGWLRGDGGALAEDRGEVSRLHGLHEHGHHERDADDVDDERNGADGETPDKRLAYRGGIDLLATIDIVYHVLDLNEADNGADEAHRAQHHAADDEGDWTCNGGYRRERAGGFQVGVDERRL